MTFYYLTCSYNIHDMVHDDRTRLCGPFQTQKLRANALKKDLDGRDLECTEIVTVTYLKTGGDDDQLYWERSFVADGENDDEWSE